MEGKRACNSWRRKSISIKPENTIPTEEHRVESWCRVEYGEDKGVVTYQPRRISVVEQNSIVRVVTPGDIEIGGHPVKKAKRLGPCICFVNVRALTLHKFIIKSTVTKQNL